MDFRYTFLVALMCLVLPVDAWQRGRRKAKATRLQSFYRMEDDQCYGNLLQIHFDGGKTQAKCDGTSIESLTTKFTVETTRGKKCIQYTDQHGGSTRYYALKVIDRTTVTFMNERCSSSTADAFLFDEERESPYRYYKHTLPNKPSLYLGVKWNCTDDRLSLICSTRKDTRCKFESL